MGERDAPSFFLPSLWRVTRAPSAAIFERRAKGKKKLSSSTLALRGGEEKRLRGHPRGNAAIVRLAFPPRRNARGASGGGGNHLTASRRHPSPYLI